MRPPSFDKLARQLRAAGAAEAVIDRIIHELRDHFADAEAEALERGASPAEARRRARRCIGPSPAIVAAVSCRRQLLDWRHRFPQSARCVDSLTWCLVAPVAPFVYCASHPAGIVRWGLSSGLAICVTATMLLGMRWLIV